MFATSLYFLDVFMDSIVEFRFFSYGFDIEDDRIEKDYKVTKIPEITSSFWCKSFNWT